MEEKVLYEVRDQVGWVTLNRPKILNAIDGDVLKRLIEIVAETAVNDDVRVLVWTGNGRAFSAGGDIKDMIDLDPKTFRPKAQLYQKLAAVSRELRKPIIGAINGYALGGGLELALNCDMRIAAASAKLGLPDAVLGFSPTGGMTYLLPRIVGMGWAMHMALIPDPLDAQLCKQIGLVTHIVEDEKLLETAHEMAKKIASYPAEGLGRIKNAFYAATDATFAGTLILEEEYDVASFSSPETQAELKKFLDSRKKS